MDKIPLIRSMNKLKVLLFRPYSKADELIPPFGLGYLATALRKNHDIQILDGIKENMTIENFSGFISENKFDVIGIQIFTFHLNAAKNYINAIKKISPETKIILGGPHPSCDPNNIFYYFPDIDFAFKGEAEIGLARLTDLISANKLQEAELKDIPGLIWRDKENKTIVNNQIFVEDLDALGYPSWDLLKPNTYPLAPHGAFFKNYPIAPIIITRGCPFNCTFCAGRLISGRKIRRRSVASVISEIKELYHKYGIREIHIEDDNFTFYKDLVMEFCGELKKNNLNISWVCPNGVRLDTLDRELLFKMKEVGLYSVSVGVESGSDSVLAHMQKSLNTEKIKEKIRLIRETRLEAIGFFVIGYPAETRKDILQTIKFAKKLDLKRANFTIFKPFPGTPITDKLIAENKLPEIQENWERYTLADAVYAPNGLTTKELKNLRRRAFLSFYLRPKILFKMAKEIKNFQHFKIVMKRILRWIF